MLKQRKRRQVIGDPLTATTLREIHAQSRPENAVFLPWPRPQDRCSCRHSLRSRAIDLTDGHDLQNTRISPQREILVPHLRSREMVGPLAALAGINVRPNAIFSLKCFNLTFLYVFATGEYSVHLNRAHISELRVIYSQIGSCSLCWSR